MNAPALQHQRIASRLLSALVVWTDGGAARGEAIHEPAVQPHPPVTVRLALTG